MRVPAASPWARTMSALYESIILFGVLFFFGYAFSALARFHGEIGQQRSAFQIYLFVVLGAYFVGFWSQGRRTLPMKTIGLELRTRAGDRQVPLVRALLRYLVASALFWGLAALAWKHTPLALILWALPYAWCVVDRDRQTLYDRLAGTRLVRPLS